MKFSLAQLARYETSPYAFTAEFDYTEWVPADSDIKGISPIKVTGSARHAGGERYIFDLEITGALYLEDAVSLETVPFPLALTTQEIFDTVDADDVTALISGQTIDLYETVWEIVILARPLSYTICALEEVL